MQILFDAYFSYLKSNGGLGNAKGYEELYKWGIVTKCKGRPNLESDDFVSEMVTWAKEMNNLLHERTQPTALKHLAEHHPSELKSAISALYDQTVPLNKRVATYINTCDKCWDEGMKQKFGDTTKARADERLASDFLTCHNPQRYTFYKSSVYDSFCDYLCIERKKAGLKLAHFYELLNDICLPNYSKQTELKNVIDKEVAAAGYEVNDLLSIQTALYLLSENQLNIYNDNNISTNMETSKYGKYINILKANHNIVLTGAPGTGKTYLARGIAKEMKAEVGFVQFHPSYDYTDFVEGLRPTKPDGNGNIGFERKDGVFKAFCKKAIEGKDKTFVFIIDEINRGEISKIFGELFFSIDQGYRGAEGNVNTQYQNLITDESDPFHDGFYVPQNVYIIGTMNDIDRSVEGMDFAMRRRFTWVEVTAEESMDNMNIQGTKRETMMRLNDEIEKMDGLGKDYELGGAYFLGDMQKDERWEYKLKPLLKEYLRGNNDVNEKMKKLKAAYDGEEHNESDADRQ